jgi:hypothetical protein
MGENRSVHGSRLFAALAVLLPLSFSNVLNAQVSVRVDQGSWKTYMDSSGAGQGLDVEVDSTGRVDVCNEFQGQVVLRLVKPNGDPHNPADIKVEEGVPGET